jgi:hypothetical protein
MEDLDVRPFDDREYPPGFRATLIGALANDPNVLRAWALSASSRDVALELMLSVELARPTPESVQKLIRCVDALGGPTCAVALASVGPTKGPLRFFRKLFPMAPAFYERAP